MRIRSILPAAIAAALVLQPVQAPAQTADRRRVAVVLLDGSDLGSWTRDPALDALLRSSASALLSTRTGSDEATEDAQRAASYASFGSGRRARPGDAGDALAERLRTAGLSAGIAGSDLAARILAFDKLPATAPEATTIARDVTVFEPPRTEAARLVTRLRALLGPRDALIVTSLRTTRVRTRDRVFLGAFAATGFGWSHGLVRSASTRRDGLITIADVAPTILISAGVDPDPSMHGRPAENATSSDPIGTLARDDDDLEHAARARRPLLRGFAWLAMTIVAASAVLLGSGRKRRTGIAAFGLTLVCAAPLAIFAEPLFAADTVTASLLWTSVSAVILAAIAFGVLKGSRGIAVVCALTSIVVLADLTLGGSVASRSPISYLLAEGSRFYGIGNELMGVVVGSTLVAVAFGYDRADASPAPGALLMTLAVALMAAPSLGAKFGSLFVAVPAFGMVAARAGGRKPTWRMAVVLEAVAAVATAIVVFADRLQPVAERSHIGTLGGAGTGATLARKATAALRLLAGSIWIAALLVPIAAAAWVARRRWIDVDLMLNVRRHLRAALAGGGLAIAGALIFNDAGTIAAAFVAIFLVSASFAAMFTIDSVRQELGR